jgi:hypothetical protein
MKQFFTAFAMVRVKVKTLRTIGSNMVKRSSALPV